MARRLAVLLGCALALALPACGGDPEPPLPDAPELVPPGDEKVETDSATETTETETETETTETDTDTDGTTGAAPAPDGGAAGTPTAGTGASGTAAPGDTPENDTPPPAGSPAERAERFCEQNPGAC